MITDYVAEVVFELPAAGVSGKDSTGQNRGLLIINGRGDAGMQEIGELLLSALAL